MGLKGRWRGKDHEQKGRTGSGDRGQFNKCMQVERVRSPSSRAWGVSRPAGLGRKEVSSGGLGCCLVEGLEDQPEAFGIDEVAFRNKSSEIRNNKMELVSEE